jgi:hypothetical protein
MSMDKTWRERARESLQAAYDAARAQGLDGKALEQALFDSYPFGQRAHTPYKVWCEERRKLLAAGQKRADASDIAKLAAWNAGEAIKVREGGSQ